MYYLLIIYLSLFAGRSSYAQTYTCDSNASCGCSTASTTLAARIIGGEIATAGAWSWAITVRINGIVICGGVLISNEYALTAAHCVNNRDASVVSIRAGSNDLDDTSSAVQTRQIIEYYVHPNYNSTAHTYDIAVLHFNSLTSTNSSTIKYACLPSENVDPYSTDSNVVAIGWGTTVSGSTSLSQYLRQVTVQIFASSSTVCRNGGLNDAYVQLCAGVAAGGKDTCQGDSGGPLMSFVNNQWVVGGLTSTGVGCARAGYPGVYTRVSTLVSFVTYVMQYGGVTGASTTTKTTTTTTTRSGSQGSSGSRPGSNGVSQYSRDLFSSIIVCAVFFVMFFK